MVVKRNNGLCNTEWKCISGRNIKWKSVSYACRIGTATYLKQHPEVYVELEKKIKKLAQGFDAILRKYKVDAQVVQMGSLMTIFFTIEKIRNYQDVCTCDTEAFSKVL